MHPQCLRQYATKAVQGGAVHHGHDHSQLGRIGFPLFQPGQVLRRLSLAIDHAQGLPGETHSVKIRSLGMLLFFDSARARNVGRVTCGQDRARLGVKCLRHSRTHFAKAVTSTAFARFVRAASLAFFAFAATSSATSACGCAARSIRYWRTLAAGQRVQRGPYRSGCGNRPARTSSCTPLADMRTAAHTSLMSRSATSARLAGSGRAAVFGSVFAVTGPCG